MGEVGSLKYLIFLLLVLTFVSATTITENSFTLTSDRDVYECNSAYCDVYIDVTNHHTNTQDFSISGIFPERVEIVDIASLENVNRPIKTYDVNCTQDINGSDLCVPFFTYEDNYVNDWVSLGAEKLVRSNREERKSSLRSLDNEFTKTFKIRYKNILFSEYKWDVKAYTDLGNTLLDPWTSSTQYTSNFVEDSSVINNVLLSANNLSGPFQGSLSHMYSFDDVYTSGGFMNETWGKEPLVITNAVTGITGIVNEGYYFDGTDDFLQLEDSSVLNFENDSDFSISVWIKLSTKPSVIYEIASKYTLEGSDYGFQFDINNAGGVYAYFADDEGQNTQTTPTSDITDNNWHHLVMSVDRDQNVTIYLDGTKSVSQDITSIDSIVNDKYFTVGGYSAVLTNYEFLGFMDELTVMNTSLSDSAVSNLYASGSPNVGLRSDLIGTYGSYLSVPIAVNATGDKYSCTVNSGAEMGASIEYFISWDNGSTFTNTTCDGSAHYANFTASSVLIYNVTFTGNGTDIAWIDEFNILLGVANEAQALDAMDDSFIVALGNPVVNTYQQIYVRYSNGTQMLGTFDKVVSSGNQRWAFNYLADSQVAVGMYNITPVLYVLEMSEGYISEIQNTVGTFINSTKN